MRTSMGPSQSPRPVIAQMGKTESISRPLLVCGLNQWIRRARRIAVNIDNKKRPPLLTAPAHANLLQLIRQMPYHAYGQKLGRFAAALAARNVFHDIAGGILTNRCSKLCSGGASQPTNSATSMAGALRRCRGFTTPPVCRVGRAP